MKLSNFPKWFLEREDASELISKMDHADWNEDVETVFDSVFVLAVQQDVDIHDNNEEHEITSKGISFYGYDTERELIEAVDKYEEDEEIVFIRHTRKYVDLDWAFEFSVKYPVPKEKPKDEPEPEPEKTAETKKIEVRTPGTGHTKPRKSI